MSGQNRIILETGDDALCAEVLERVAASGMPVSPTLVVADFYTGNWPVPDAPWMRLTPSDLCEDWRRPDFRREAMTDEVRDLAAESLALIRFCWTRTRWKASRRRAACARYLRGGSIARHSMRLRRCFCPRGSERAAQPNTRKAGKLRHIMTAAILILVAFLVVGVGMLLANSPTAR